MNGQSQLRERYASVLRQIESACARAGRPRDSVSLLAVSKTFSREQVLELAQLGQRGFGENYLQEALEKIRSASAERPDAALEWHFIGPIQSNKTRAIAGAFAWVHSIERLNIAERLNAQRPANMPHLNVCLQVNVSGEASKSGCKPEDARDLARRLAALPRLRLRGLMAIPEPTEEHDRLQGQFAMVRSLYDALRAEGLALDTLSMGMSADLDIAIANGATMVRIGSAIFGWNTSSRLSAFGIGGHCAT